MNMANFKIWFTVTIIATVSVVYSLPTPRDPKSLKNEDLSVNDSNDPKSLKNIELSVNDNSGLNLLRRKRHTIKLIGRNRCAKGMIWYIMECKTYQEYKDMEYDDIASITEAVQTIKSESDDTFDTNVPLTVLPQIKHDPIMPQGITAGTELNPLVTDITFLMTDSTPIVTELSPVVTELPRVVAELSPVVTKITPVVTESTPVETDSTAVVTESTVIVTEPTPAVTKITLVDIELTPQPTIQTIVIYTLFWLGSFVAIFFGLYKLLCDVICKRTHQDLKGTRLQDDVSTSNTPLVPELPPGPRVSSFYL